MLSFMMCHHLWSSFMTKVLTLHLTLHYLLPMQLWLIIELYRTHSRLFFSACIAYLVQVMHLYWWFCCYCFIIFSVSEDFQVWTFLATVFLKGLIQPKGTLWVFVWGLLPLQWEICELDGGRCEHDG